MTKLLEQNCLKAKRVRIKGMMGDGGLGLTEVSVRFFYFCI